MEERAIQWTKGQSEYVNGRTGYTMDKRKKTKRQRII
jgi:hypothetical protein